MKKLIIIIILTLGLAMETSAVTQDINDALRLTFVSLASIDWIQTKEFRDKGRSEGNIFLTEFPSQERVDITIGVGIICACLASEYLINEKWEPVFLTMLILAEAHAIKWNIDKGNTASYKLKHNYSISFEYKF